MELKQIVFLPTWLFVRAYREYPILSVTGGLIYLFQVGEAISRAMAWLANSLELQGALYDLTLYALVLFLLLPGIMALWVFVHRFFGAFLELFAPKGSWTPQKTIIDVVEWVLK